MLCSIPIVILYLYMHPYQDLLVMRTQSPVSGFCYAQNRVCHAVYHEYRYLRNDLTSKYRHVEFVNLSIGSLGIFGQSSDSFIQMCNDLTIDKAHTNYIITKLSTIIICTIYYIHYIFCMRNKLGLTQTFYPTNSFLSSFGPSY